MKGPSRHSLLTSRYSCLMSLIPFPKRMRGDTRSERDVKGMRRKTSEPYGSCLSHIRSAHPSSSLPLLASFSSFTARNVRRKGTGGCERKEWTAHASSHSHRAAGRALRVPPACRGAMGMENECEEASVANGVRTERKKGTRCQGDKVDKTGGQEIYPRHESWT